MNMVEGADALESHHLTKSIKMGDGGIPSMRCLVLLAGLLLIAGGAAAQTTRMDLIGSDADAPGHGNPPETPFNVTYRYEWSCADLAGLPPMQEIPLAITAVASEADVVADIVHADPVPADACIVADSGTGRINVTWRFGPQAPGEVPVTLLVQADPETPQHVNMNELHLAAQSVAAWDVTLDVEILDPVMRDGKQQIPVAVTNLGNARANVELQVEAVGAAVSPAAPFMVESGVAGADPTEVVYLDAAGAGPVDITVTAVPSSTRVPDIVGPAATAESRTELQGDDLPIPASPAILVALAALALAALRRR